MNSTKKGSGVMNSSKNKINSKISWLFNFCQTHTLYSYVVVFPLYLLKFIPIYIDFPNKRKGGLEGQNLATN